jgi:hypothetical protein
MGYVAIILIACSFGAAIFHALLGIERTVWSVALGQPEALRVDESDLRFVHYSLKRLIGYLPPSNGLVIIATITGLIWQGVATNWHLASIIVLAWWVLGQLYILTFGRIVAAVIDVRDTPSDGDVRFVRRGVLKWTPFVGPRTVGIKVESRLLFRFSFSSKTL